MGLQCTYKDEKRDRLILDARPPNAHKVHLKRFVRHMANASMLFEIVLPDDEILASYLDDIRDMYYVKSRMPEPAGILLHEKCLEARSGG